MSHTLLFGFDEPLAKWACERIPWATYDPTMRAVGVADGAEADAALLAVCVYHGYIPARVIDGKPWYGLCEISMAAASPRWATRRTISNLLRIPFLQYACRKVVTVIPSTNKRAIRFNEGIGFKPEGPLRHHFAKGVHAVICGMMRSEFDRRWADPTRRPSPTAKTRHEQEHGINAASA